MNFKSKKFLIFYLVSIIVLLVTFAYIFFELKRTNNPFIIERKEATEVKKDAEIVLIFDEIKGKTETTFLTTQKANFSYLDKNISGRKVIFVNLDEPKLKLIYDFFANNRYDQENPDSEGTRLYSKGNLICLVKQEYETNIGVYCGYQN